MRLLVASALAALALAGPAAADVRPHLRLASTEPPIVRGGGFPGHERVTVLAVAVVGLAGAPAAQAAKQGRKPIAAAGPQVTRGARDQGAAPQAAAQSLRVYLAPRGGEDALKAAVAAVSTPGSPTYGQYLT